MYTLPLVYVFFCANLRIFAISRCFKSSTHAVFDDIYQQPNQPQIFSRVFHPLVLPGTENHTHTQQLPIQSVARDTLMAGFPHLDVQTALHGFRESWVTWHLPGLKITNNQRPFYIARLVGPN